MEGEQMECAAVLAKTPSKPKDKSSKNTGKTGSAKNNFACRAKAMVNILPMLGKLQQKNRFQLQHPRMILWRVTRVSTS